MSASLSEHLKDIPAFVINVKTRPDRFMKSLEQLSFEDGKTFVKSVTAMEAEPFPEDDEGLLSYVNHYLGRIRTALEYEKSLNLPYNAILAEPTIVKDKSRVIDDYTKVNKRNHNKLRKLAGQASLMNTAMMILRHIIENNIPRAIICEDDIAIREYVATRVEVPEVLPDIVVWGGAVPSLVPEFRRLANEVNPELVPIPYKHVWYAQCYEVSLEGAKKLLKTLEDFYCTMDISWKPLLIENDYLKMNVDLFTQFGKSVLRDSKDSNRFYPRTPQEARDYLEELKGSKNTSFVPEYLAKDEPWK